MTNKAHEQQSEIKQLISKGLEQGYLTYAEINDHLPDDIVDPEQIEDIMAVLKGVGIEVHDSAPDTDTISDGAAHAPGVEIGRFGAHMKVHLINDGPVTFRLEVR